VLEVKAMSPAQRMGSLDIVQEGAAVLAQVARPFDLPTEAVEAQEILGRLVEGLERVEGVHDFSKGMGLAAPQIDISRAAVVVLSAEGDRCTLLNPRVVAQSSEMDEQYEGCLSFFDVRGLVPRPLVVDVEHEDLNGKVQLATFERGLARLVYHEIDHLAGILYRSRMKCGVEPIPVFHYQGTGHRWTYR
jgi:peptide deformylase